MNHFQLERSTTDLPFWFGHFVIHHCSRGRVLQLSLDIVENTGVDTLLHDYHRKLWPVEDSEELTE